MNVGCLQNSVSHSKLKTSSKKMVMLCFQKWRVFVVCLLACLLAWLVGWLVGWLFGWLVGWLFAVVVASCLPAASDFCFLWGAMLAASYLPWTAQQRLAVIITDAPCHGKDALQWQPTATKNNQQPQATKTKNNQLHHTTGISVTIYSSQYIIIYIYNVYWYVNM